jgi:prevent-host-death family protein
MTAWKLYDAKNQLSSLVERAKAVPQTITVRGKAEVVVMSVDAYRRQFEPRPHLADALLALGGILDDEDLALFERDPSTVERGTALPPLDDD